MTNMKRSIFLSIFVFIVSSSCTKVMDTLPTEKVTSYPLIQQGNNNSANLSNTGIDPCVAQMWKDFTNKDPNVSSNYLNCISPENRDDPWGFESGGGIYGIRGPIVPPAEPCFD